MQHTYLNVSALLQQLFIFFKIQRANLIIGDKQSTVSLNVGTKQFSSLFIIEPISNEDWVISSIREIHRNYVVSRISLGFYG